MAGRHAVDAVTVLERLEGIGVVPVVTIDRVDRAVDLGEALLAGGVPCAEITFRTPAAAAVIGELAAAHPDLLVGAGTVIDVAQAQAAAAAGARFVMSPVLDADVVDWCRAHELLVVPGVTTPTEIHAARRLGLDVVKFFPASTAGGTDALRILGSVFPDVRFVPTGGIDAGNLAAHLELASVVACGGSWMTPRELIERGEFDRIQELAAAAASIAREARARR